MLITAAEVADTLGVSSTDALLVRLVSSTDAWIKRACGRQFERAIYTSIVRSSSFDYGTNLIFLPESPIVEIIAVSLDRSGAGFTTDTVIDDLSAFTFDPLRDDGRVYYSGGRFPVWPGGSQFEYEAGYDADIPEDLRERLIERVCAKYKQGADEEMKQESKGDRAWSKFDETDKRILAALRGYKR